MKEITDYLEWKETGTHSLRKYRANEIYEKSGHDIEMVRAFLNHSSVLTSQRYIRRSDAQLEKAISESIKIVQHFYQINTDFAIFSQKQAKSSGKSAFHHF